VPAVVLPDLEELLGRPDDLRVQARQRLADGLRLPTGLHPVLAAAVAVQVGAAAYGIAAQTTAGLAVALAGVAVLMGVAALLLYQFRRINGVRVDGLSSQIVLGTGGTSTLVYLGGFGAATWAAFESLWWLVAAAAVAAGVGYSFGTLRWWHAYRHDPAKGKPSLNVTLRGPDASKDQPIAADALGWSETTPAETGS